MGRIGAGRGKKKRAPKDAKTAAARLRSGRGQRLSGSPLSKKSLSSIRSPANKGRKTKNHSPSEDFSRLSNASARHRAGTEVHEQAPDDSDEIATQQSFTQRPLTLNLSPSDSDNDDREDGSDVRASSNGKRRKLSVKLSRTVTSGRAESLSPREATQSTSHGRKDSVIGREPCGAAEFCLNLHNKSFNLKPAHKCICCQTPVHNLCSQAAGLDEGVFGCSNVISSHWERQNKELTTTLEIVKVGSVDVQRFVAKDAGSLSGVNAESEGEASVMECFTAAVVDNAISWIKERTQRDFPDIDSLKTVIRHIEDRQPRIVKQYNKSLSDFLREATIMEKHEKSLKLSFREVLLKNLKEIYIRASLNASAQDFSDGSLEKCFCRLAKEVFEDGKAKAMKPSLFPGIYENGARKFATKEGATEVPSLCCIAPFLLAADTGNLLFTEDVGKMQELAKVWCNKTAALTLAIRKANDPAPAMASFSGGPADGRGIRWKGPEMTNLAARLVEAILADEHRELREGLFGSRNHRAGQQAAKDLNLDRYGCARKIAEIIRGNLVVERQELPGTGGTVPVFVSVENSVENRPFCPENMYADLFPEINPSALPPSTYRVNSELVLKMLNTLKKRVVIAYNSAARSGRNERDAALIYSEDISNEGDLGASDTLEIANAPTHSQPARSDAGDGADARERAKRVEEFHASYKHVGTDFRSDLIAYVVHIAFDADEPSRQALAREIFALQWPRRHSGRRKGSSSLPRCGESGLDAGLARLVHDAASTLHQHSLATTPSSAGQLELATMNALPVQILNYLQIVEKTNSLQRDLRKSGNVQGSSRIAELEESVMDTLGTFCDKLKCTKSLTMSPSENEDDLSKRSPSDYGSDMEYM